jgi:hypothetical protein
MFMLPGVAINQMPLSIFFDPLFRTYIKDDRPIQTAKVKISLRDSEQYAYELEFNYQEGGTEPAPVSLQQKSQIMLHRQKLGPDGSVQANHIVPITTDAFGRLQHPPLPPFGPTAFIFDSSQAYDEGDDVQWFSRLREKNQTDSIVSFFRRQFPFIKDIEVLAPTGTTGLYAIMADGSARRLTTVSRGIYKLVSILLALVETPGGIVVIDEIENGIFYENYQDVWSILYTFAVDTNCQLFITSHSMECLQGLIPTMKGNESDFTLLRSERSGNEIIIRHMTGRAMEAALLRDGELRGVTGGSNGDPQ